LDQHVTATFVLDEEGRVAVWNKACEMLLGLSAVSVIGTRDHWKAFYTSPRPCLADRAVQRSLLSPRCNSFQGFDAAGVREIPLGKKL
jgi:PAS domain-containing protein